MHLKTLGSYVQVAWSIADLGLPARFPPTKMSYILVVKSHLHPGVFIMAFDIFQGTPILYTSWFYDRIFHGQFQNPHKPWGSVTESDS